MKKNECLAMLLAGGQGSRLYSLTDTIPKPALSFGGKYRIIDFSLSNLKNSGIYTVGVLTQYKPFALNSYVGVGSAWDFDVCGGGMYVLPPYMSQDGGAWYTGTANAVYQNMNFVDLFNPEYVLIVSADHIYKMDYSKMLDRHKQTGADVTVAATPVSMEEASRFGILDIDDNGLITDFTEKPDKPKNDLASMGVYIFKWDILRRALINDAADINSSNDFGKNIIPKLLADNKKLYAYEFYGYWKDVGTVDSYYEANMELLCDAPAIDIYDKHIYSNIEEHPPLFIGDNANIKKSILSSGCKILGSVNSCIVSSDVYIGNNTVVTNSLLLPGARVFDNCIIDRSIIGEGTSIKAGTSLGMHDMITVR